MPWFLTPHGPHFVVEPGTVDEYERRDYVVMTAQQVTDYYAGVAFPDPPSFATEAEVPGIMATVAANPTSAFSVAQRVALVPQGALTIDATLHGVVGDGVVDDGAALNALIAAAPVGAEIFLRPGLTVKTTVPILPKSGTRISGYGATLEAHMAGVNDRLLRILNVTDVLVEGLTLDGRKASFASATEQRHNLDIRGSSRVLVRDVLTVNAKGDGVYVGDDAAISTDVVLERVTATGNHRQGLSITHTRGFRATDCVFEASSGIHPQAGVDIEPNTDATVVDDIDFVNCVFRGCVSYGLIVSLRDAPTVRQGGLSFTNCAFDGNGEYGMRLHNARHVRFIACQIRDNTKQGVYFTGNFGSDVTFIGCEIARSGLDGLACFVPFTRLTVLGCRVVDNSQTTTGTSDGIAIGAGGAAIATVSLIGNHVGGATQRYGLRTLPGVTGLTLMGNEYFANATGATSLADEAASRFTSGRSGSQFPALDLTGRLGHILATSNDTAHGVRVTGDTQDRVMIRADGSIYWSAGSGALDTRLYRFAADTLRTDDKFIASLGLGVGNSVAATTPGTVVRKMEVFDASGNSLGFVPIYSAIT